MLEVIFLDFDGVVHRQMNESFEYLPNLYKVLDLFPEIKIVISNDWRHCMNKDSYTNIFGTYGSRIVGATGKHESKMRELEIMEYANMYNIKNFIAIDDDCRNRLFSPNCEWLFKTNYYKGLNDETTARLISFIQQRYN